MATTSLNNQSNQSQVAQSSAAYAGSEVDYYLGSCFNPDLDTGDAQVRNLVLPVKTGVNRDGVAVSKFLVEGVMLFYASLAKEFGFAAGRKKFVVRWLDDSKKTEFVGVLEFDTMRYLTNAPGNSGRQGFGLAGIGAAIYSQSEEFVIIWTDLLVDMKTNGLKSITAERTTALSIVVAESLAGMEQRGKGPWKWHPLPPEYIASLGDVENTRDQLTNVDDMLMLMTSLTLPATPDTQVFKFQGPQVQKLMNFIKRRKHTVLLGPQGTGKSLSAFEALLTLGYEHRGTDYQVFVGHDEVKSSDLLGAYQPTAEAGKFVWMNGVLPRAMTANGGRGQPLLIEEFTRMPRRAQNAVLSVLSDGYLVLNEHPVEIGQSGEIVTAGPDFVLIADMNVDPSIDDLELYGAAFASRVRKLWYDYPSTAMMKLILTQQVPELPAPARNGIISTYDAVLNRWKAQELAAPISARDCVYWGEEIAACLDSAGSKTTSVMREAALEGARVTWLRDVAGNEPIRLKSFESEIEGHFRKAISSEKSDASRTA